MARANSIQEVFDSLPGRYQPDKAGGLQAVIQFDLNGEGGGQYSVTLGEAGCSVASGAAANPNMTLTASADDYLNVVNGDLNAMQAFMQGKIRVKGDMAIAMKLQAIFGF